jgi:LAO/AO transport system kinase
VEPHHYAGEVARGILSGQTPRPMGAPGWTPPVLQTVAVTGEGVPALADVLERHFEFLHESGELVRQRRARLAQHTRDVVDRSLRQMVWSESGGEALLAGELGAVVSGDLSPYEVAEHIVAGFRKGMRHAG